MKKIIMVFLLSFCAATAVAQNFKYIEVTLENGSKSRFPVYHYPVVQNEVKVTYEGDSYWLYARIYANGSWEEWGFMDRIQAEKNIWKTKNIISRLETISMIHYEPSGEQFLIVPDGQGTSQSVGDSYYIVRRKIYIIVIN